MSFAGWPLASIAAFLAAGVAGVTALYLLRIRRRRVVVPFAALWQEVLRTSEARRLARRFRRPISWLVQVVLLGLLALALADPRPAAWLRPPRTTVFVVDAGASMAAETNGGERRIDAAFGRLERELAALGPADRAAVVLAGPTTDVAVPLAPAPEVRSRLVPIEPKAGPARFDDALAVAAALTQGAEGPSILVLTDGAVDDASRAALEACVEGPVPCRIHRTPGPAANVGIAAFAARRRPFDPERVELVARIENHDEVPHAVVVEVASEGVPVGRVEATIPPGAEHRHVFDDLDAPGAVLEARIASADGTPLPGPALDDTAHATIPPVRPARVVLVTDGTDLFLDAALLSLGESVDVTAVAPDDREGLAEAAARADVAIVDVGAEPLPPLPAGVHLVVFDPWRHDDAAFPIPKGRDVRRPFLTEQDRSHPVLEDVSLVDVNVARGTTFRTGPGDEVLVRTVGEPIVVLRAEGGRKILAVGFDPRQSDLPLRVAFPLLLANALDLFAAEAPGYVATVRAGIPATIDLTDLGLDARTATRARIEGPDGTQLAVPVHDGRVRVLLDRPGIATVVLEDGEAAGVRGQVAVNAVALGALGDGLADLPWARRADAGPAPEPFPVVDDPLWFLLLVLVALAGAVEWWTYHRRITV